MSLTTFSFFAFLAVTTILFYVIKPLQKYILLAASMAFYILISPGSRIRLCILILCVGLITYIGALASDKAKGKLKTLAAFISVASLIALQFMFKLAFNVAGTVASLFNIQSDISWLQFGAVVGMSYYTLTAIGYIVDVTWGSTKADRNIADVFLFIFFFPQLISGPITRSYQMIPQFNAKKSFDMDRFT